MSDIDLEKGLAEFLDHTREAFLRDPGYAERIALRAQRLITLERDVD